MVQKPLSDGPGNFVDDEHLPDRLQDATLSATYAPLKSARPGNLVATLGDSIMQANDDNATQGRQGSPLNWASILSRGLIQYGRNAGVSGNTTAQMLARFDTDVTPYSPAAVLLTCGTNDVGTISLSAWSTSVLAILAKIRAIGAVPILGTIPPSNTASKKQAINQFNGYLRRVAALQGLAVIDFYTLLADPTNSNYKAAYFNDGTHPNAAGYRAMGQLISDSMSSILPAAAPLLCSDDVDSVNMFTKGCFGGFTGSALPTGWTDNAGAPSGSVLSYTTDAQVPGQMLTITQTASALRQPALPLFIGSTTLTNAVSAGATSCVIPIRADYGGVLFVGTPGSATFEVVKIASSSGGGPQTETLVSGFQYAHAAGEPVVANAAPGDEIIFSGVVTSDGNVECRAETSCTGAAYSPAAMRVTGAITRGVFHQRFTVPPSTTKISFLLYAGAGTGVVSYGRLGAYNATRLGI